MDHLMIDVAENGFIVIEGEGGRGMGMQGKKWAFETPESLAAFVKDWAEKKGSIE